MSDDLTNEEIAEKHLNNREKICCFRYAHTSHRCNPHAAIRR